MTPILRFRLFAFFILAFVGAASVANLAVEALRPAAPPLPLKGNRAPAPDQISAASLASAIAPFRSDLKGDYAIALAGQLLSGQSSDERSARDAISDALKIGPHDSRLWLVLGLIQARHDRTGPLFAKSMKMSYLTGPNRAELIPARLETVTANNSLTDPDLGELARGDVRAMLTQLPGQRPVLTNDYAHASEIGKKFLEESVSTIEPGFVGTLRGGG